MEMKENLASPLTPPVIVEEMTQTSQLVGAAMHEIGFPDPTQLNPEDPKPEEALQKRLSELEQDARDKGIFEATNPDLLKLWAVQLEENILDLKVMSPEIFFSSPDKLEERIQNFIDILLSPTEGRPMEVVIKKTIYAVKIFHLPKPGFFETKDGQKVDAFGVRDERKKEIRIFIKGETFKDRSFISPEPVTSLLHEGLEHTQGISHTEAFFAEAFIEGVPKTVSISYNGTRKTMNILVPSRVFPYILNMAANNSEKLSTFIDDYTLKVRDEILGDLRMQYRRKNFKNYRLAMAQAIHEFAIIARELQLLLDRFYSEAFFFNEEVLDDKARNRTLEVLIEIFEGKLTLEESKKILSPFFEIKRIEPVLLEIVLHQNNLAVVKRLASQRQKPVVMLDFVTTERKLWARHQRESSTSLFIYQAA